MTEPMSVPDRAALLARLEKAMAEMSEGLGSAKPEEFADWRLLRDCRDLLRAPAPPTSIAQAVKNIRMWLVQSFRYTASTIELDEVLTREITAAVIAARTPREEQFVKQIQRLQETVAILQRGRDETLNAAPAPEGWQPHKVLDRLGKSSYQEVIEDQLREKLAVTEIRAETAEAERDAALKALRDIRELVIQQVPRGVLEPLLQEIDKRADQGVRLAPQEEEG